MIGYVMRGCTIIGCVKRVAWSIYLVFQRTQHHMLLGALGGRRTRQLYGQL